jgi:hypothetical protein
VALVMGAFVLVYVALTAFAGWVRMATAPLWMDEIFTYYQVDAKTFPQLLDSLHSGINQLPYAYFLLMWLLGQWVTLTDSVLRMPSAVFAVATAAVLHRWLSRRFGHAVAFAAVVGALYLSAESRWYMAEARPYSLYVLAAALNLVAASRLVADERGSVGPWWWNAVASGLLPSIHYTGLAYSGGLLGAALFSAPRDWSHWWRVAASFAAGWLVFGMIHFGQMSEILAAGGARWIPRPGAAEAFHVLIAQLKLPEIVVWLCAAGMVLRMFAAAGAPGPAPGSGPATAEDRFFCWAAVGWLLVPAVLVLMAAAGLPNMALSRYFQPSHLAVAMASALVLNPFLNRGGFWPPRAPTSGARRSRLVPLAVGGIVALFVMQWMLADRALVARSSTSGRDLVRSRYAPFVHSVLPAVTNDWQAFFEYNYHSHGQLNLTLLVNSEQDVAQWKRFHHDLRVMTPMELSFLNDFWFFPWPVAYQLFDITEWCDSNHCRVADRMPFKNGLGYHVVKQKPAAPLSPR